MANVEARPEVNAGSSGFNLGLRLSTLSEAVGNKGRAVALAAVLAACQTGSPITPASAERPTLTPEPTRTTLITPEPTPLEEARQIYIEIRHRYGVEIPTEVNPKYSSHEFDGAIRPNLIPTLEQAQVIEKAIALLPNPNYFASLIIPYRNDSEGAVAGGSYMGQQWPAFIHPEDYPEFPYDRFVSEISSIDLEIPNAKSSDLLPVKSGQNSVLPFIVQISVESADIEVNLDEDVPWTNHAERLEQTVVHEFFHGVEDKFSLANSSSIEDYWDKQAFTLFGNHTRDITNPLFVTFAQVTGWKLTSSYEIMKQYDPELAEKNLKEHPISARNTMFWERDPNIWGNLANRQNHLTIYNSYGPIQESMAETWMAFYLYPELLTPGERQYFQNLDEGLRRNPEAFINKAVENPNILLENVASL